MKNTNNLFNHLKAMKEEILGKVQANPSLLGTSWKRIPDIETCKLSEPVVNELLGNVGIQKINNREKTFTFNKLKKANRYMEHQIIRARKALKNGNYVLFWTIAKTTIEKSVSFRVSAFNKTFQHWYYDESLRAIQKKLYRIERMIKEWDDNLKFRRVYIPKANNKTRPLGVPSGEWRVISQMWANWLAVYFENKLNFNHAYQPGKGTLTAWKEVITKVLNKKYIYEFDLKNFFDEASIVSITEFLEKNTPKKIVYHLENINRCTPENMEEVQEELVRNKWVINSSFKSTNFTPEIEIISGLKDFVKTNGIDLLNELMAEDGYTDPVEYAQAQWAMFDHYKPHGFGAAFKGLPQGLNTSPLLAISTLIEKFKELKSQGIGLTMYADDGLLFSNKPFDPSWDLINIEKSKWLKKDGKWLIKDFKYLGLKYNVETMLLEGSTRKGSTLTFDIARQGLFQLISNLKGVETEYTDLEKLAFSGVFGLIQSRLYDGTWDIRTYPERKWDIHKDSLWGYLERKERNNLSSSVGMFELMVMVNRSMRR
jgi:hypothetical protein